MDARAVTDLERLRLLEALHGQLPHGVATFDLRLRLVHANASWLAFAGAIAGRDTSITGGARLSDLLSGQAAWLSPAVQRALAGETTHISGQPVAGNDAEVFWDITLAPVREDGLVNGLICVVEDATARVQAEQSTAALRERDTQYHSIFNETTDGLVIYTLGERHIVEANPALCALTGFGHDQLMGMDPLLLIAPADRQRVIEAGEIVTDAGRFMLTMTVVRNDGTTFDAELNRTTFLYHGRPHGLAVVRDVTARAQSYRFLEARVAERTGELQTLLEVSRTVALASDLEPLFELIFDQLARLVDYEAAAIALLERDYLRTVAVRRDELGSRSPSSLGNRIRVDWHEPTWQAFAAGRALYTPDILAEDELAHWFRQTVGEHLLQTTLAHVRSELWAPLVVQHELIGAMFIASARVDRFQQHDIDLVLATANQVAVAIQNARLHGQARSVAALEERQRLARELHDSVSQALFGIGLGAQTGLTVLGRDPAKVEEPLRYILDLANSGLAEMRALIFELRPESLEQEGLVRAIEKQAAALGARHRVTIEAELGPEPDASLPAKEALYRIAQEAMHNAVKHAKPTTIRLRLALRSEVLELDVADDGVGFDASGSFPGHLGLKSMPERAERLGGRVTIISSPGSGTLVHASIPI